MSFINAEKGIKKIYISEIFAVLAAIVGDLALRLIDYVAQIHFTDWIVIISLFLGVLCLVLQILCIIFGFIGCINAAKDEEEFKKAFYCTIAAGSLAIISIFIQSFNNTAYALIESSETVIEMFVMIFSVSGLINISEKCECTDMEDKGIHLLKLLTATYVIAAINALVIRMFELSENAQAVSYIIGIVDLIIKLVQYFLYLGYLKKSKAMLSSYIGANI